jgi:hypothetical protein
LRFAFPFEAERNKPIGDTYIRDESRFSPTAPAANMLAPSATAQSPMHLASQAGGRQLTLCPGCIASFNINPQQVLASTDPSLPMEIVMRPTLGPSALTGFALSFSPNGPETYYGDTGGGIYNVPLWNLASGDLITMPTYNDVTQGRSASVQVDAWVDNCCARTMNTHPATGAPQSCCPANSECSQQGSQWTCVPVAPCQFFVGYELCDGSSNFRTNEGIVSAADCLAFQSACTPMLAALQASISAMNPPFCAMVSGLAYPFQCGASVYRLDGEISCADGGITELPLAPDCQAIINIVGGANDLCTPQNCVPPSP